MPPIAFSGSSGSGFTYKNASIFRGCADSTTNGPDDHKLGKRADSRCDARRGSREKLTCFSLELISSHKCYGDCRLFLEWSVGMENYCSKVLKRLLLERLCCSTEGGFVFWQFTYTG